MNGDPILRRIWRVQAKLARAAHYDPVQYAANAEKKVREIEKRYGSGRVIKLDGLTVEFDDWWFNVRPSQTEPLLRLNVEARNKDEMEQKVQELLDMIRS